MQDGIRGGFSQSERMIFWHGSCEAWPAGIDNGNQCRSALEGDTRAAWRIAARNCPTSGSSSEAVSAIELGKVSPSVETLKRLLDCLDISLADFFAPEGSGPSSAFFGRMT